jgi:hypothetical protein
VPSFREEDLLVERLADNGLFDNIAEEVKQPFPNAVPPGKFARIK